MCFDAFDFFLVMQIPDIQNKERLSLVIFMAPADVLIQLLCMVQHNKR